MDELKELNETYFGLFSDLRLALEWLPEKEYDFMVKILHRQYVEDLETCLIKRILEVGISTFELKFKSRVYVPRRGFFGYNRIAKRLLKKYKAEFLTELKKLELDVKDEKDVHDKLDAEIRKPSETQSTALPVPVNTKVEVSTDKNDVASSS